MKTVILKRFISLFCGTFISLSLSGQITLDVKVYLEGPFGTSEMSTGLNSGGLIPLQQPYNVSPWNYPGTEQVASIPNTEVVDWVLVELRETTGNASTAIENNIISRQAGLILKNGMIRSIDGTSMLSFAISVTSNLYVVIHHRNHLPVLSAEALTLAGGVYAYDFSTSASKAFGGSLAHKELVAGIWGMAAGDGNADRQISGLDKIDVWLLQAGSSGYKAGDFDLNGQVNNTDKLENWAVNAGKSAQIPGIWSCGSSLQVTHTAGYIAPVNKMVSYGTVQTNLTGSDKCWITQNLGSDHQATSATDNTESSAGWYWQFNRKQGYMHDGVSRVPNIPWITSLNENSNWLSSNDPCELLVGTGWRLPTNTEWSNASFNGAWINYNGSFASVLKIHAAGYLHTNDGNIISRGSLGYYWSSVQSGTTQGYSLRISSTGSNVNNDGKAYGFSLRCLHDIQTAWSCGDPLTVTHTAGNIAPVDKIVDYSTVQTDLTGSTKCWIIQNLGADHQAASATDNTEASAGWYWQFNKPQGYKHDGTTRTPNTIWLSTINENSDWLTANDPCVLLLGTGWRLPTYTEWYNADLNGGWNNLNNTYASVLKLHAAGYLGISYGALGNRGSVGYYWSSTQDGSPTGWGLIFFSSGSYMGSSSKASGFSSRCLCD